MGPKQPKDKSKGTSYPALSHLTRMLVLSASFCPVEYCKQFGDEGGWTEILEEARHVSTLKSVLVPLLHI